MHSHGARAILVLLAAGVAGGPVTAAPLQGASEAVPAAKCDEPCVLAKVDRHLLLMGEFGNDEELQASLREVVASGPLAVRVVRDTYNHWAREEKRDPKTGARPGEMRWRAVHLLGSLGMADAVPSLYEMARAPLPDPRRSEQLYADEYRVRLRAIAGLENLKGVDELKELHALGGVLRSPTAASLYVLGVNVGGVSRVEAKTALAEDTADATDFKAGKGRPPQPEKPGSPKFKVKRRPDTPSVKPAE
jgi:hypothetical protein